MTSRLADQLSRVLVGCHPRRWRQRYGDELLDVLGQPRAGVRTVLDLAFSAADAHLGPAWRMQPSMAGLRRSARGAAPFAAALAALVLVVGGLVAFQAWQEGHWHPGDNAGVTALAFSPDHRILVSAVGFDEDGTDTIWDVAGPALLRQLATFEGGAPAATRGQNRPDGPPDQMDHRTTRPDGPPHACHAEPVSERSASASFSLERQRQTQRRETTSVAIVFSACS